MKTVKRKPLGQLIPLLALGVVVLASVFVYNPIQGTLDPQEPPIIFAPGSNAGQPDLNGTTITVTISSSGTSVSITVHPTYEKVYYKNLTVIKNKDDGGTAYNLWIDVTDALSDPKITSAQLIVRNATNYVIATIPITATTTTPIGITPALAAGDQYTLDLEIKIANTGGDPNTAPAIGDTVFSLELIYSPSTETPP